MDSIAWVKQKHTMESGRGAEKIHPPLRSELSIRHSALAHEAAGRNLSAALVHSSRVQQPRALRCHGQRKPEEQKVGRSLFASRPHVWAWRAIRRIWGDIPPMSSNIPPNHRLINRMVRTRMPHRSLFCCVSQFVEPTLLKSMFV